MYLKLDSNDQISIFPYQLTNLKKDHPLVSFPRLPQASLLAEYGVYEVTINPPAFNLQTQFLTATGPELVEGAWQMGYTVNDRPLAEIKTNKLAELNAYAKTNEEQGITLPNDFFARTDAQTQIRLTQAMQQAQMNPDVTFDWKLADGTWTVLDATQIAQIQGAVLAHVQACFTREKELSEALNACTTLEQLQAIDINAGWPE